MSLDFVLSCSPVDFDFIVEKIMDGHIILLFNFNEYFIISLFKVIWAHKI